MCVYRWRLKIKIDFDGMPLNDEKEQTTDTHKNMDESEGNYAKWKGQH